VTDFFNHTVGLPYGWAWFLATIIGILAIALPLMLSVAMIIYADRKIWAAMALRRGPNVVGPVGLLQSFRRRRTVDCSCSHRSSPSRWR
jgi:NADH-quinone oxidoreductase subunit H